MANRQYLCPYATLPIDANDATILLLTGSYVMKENAKQALTALLSKGQIFTDSTSLISYEVDAGLNRGKPEGHRLSSLGGRCGTPRSLGG